MASNHFTVLLFVFYPLISTWAQLVTLPYSFDNNYIPTELNDVRYEIDDQTKNEQDKVEIKLLYECLCPDCRQFDSSQFVDVVKKLHNYLNINTYPYGNAKTFIDNGDVTFKCQHGPKECYGNKLHACAIDKFSNKTEALLYNACMMDYSQDGFGSDDLAAERCATSMNVNCEPIKKCAKSARGTQLLKYYGEESQKINYQYVPYILVNGKESNGSDFMGDVCAAFKSPPPACQQYETISVINS